MGMHLIWKMPAAFLSVALTFAGCANPQLAERRAGRDFEVTADPSPATMSVPVKFQSPDADVVCSVTARNFLGEPETVGHFNAGEIVTEVFREFAGRNFAAPSPVLPPAGSMVVRICRITAMKAGRGRVNANVEIAVEFHRKGYSKPEYSKCFSGEATEKWTDEGLVPEAFYEALRNAVGKFLAEWRRGDPSAEVAMWTVQGPGPKYSIICPPEIVNWCCEPDGKVACTGMCEVACNDWDALRAKEWANKSIDIMAMEKCVKNLGEKPERIRILQDEKLECKKWHISFRAVVHSDNDPPKTICDSLEETELKGGPQIRGWKGVFMVNCNGAKDSDAAAAAYIEMRNSFIEVFKQAGIEQDRLRMVIAKRTPDRDNEKKLKIEAYAFPLPANGMAISFNGKEGFLIVAPDLMGLETGAALKKAEEYVQSEMDKRVGVDVPKGEAKVSWDEYTPEPIGNLIVEHFVLN